MRSTINGAEALNFPLLIVCPGICVYSSDNRQSSTRFTSCVDLAAGLPQ